ncbi:MAG: hypothetical protein B7W97_00605 [Mycobacterium sp. 20-66-4]|nr:MAG: hypothetical protein B7W97_00605 [Mycobacterium sp. 20-66-4]
MESARTPGNIVVQRKGVQRYTVTARGVASHAGADHSSGKSAVLELAHQMVQFCTLPNLPHGVTVNIGPFKGGTAPNAVTIGWPPKSSVTPKPGNSRIRQRKCSANVGRIPRKLRQPVTPGPEPCRNSNTGLDCGPQS